MRFVVCLVESWPWILLALAGGWQASGRSYLSTQPRQRELSASRVYLRSSHKDAPLPPPTHRCPHQVVLIVLEHFFLLAKLLVDALVPDVSSTSVETMALQVRTPASPPFAWHVGTSVPLRCSASSSRSPMSTPPVALCGSLRPRSSTPTATTRRSWASSGAEAEAETLCLPSPSRHLLACLLSRHARYEEEVLDAEEPIAAHRRMSDLGLLRPFRPSREEAFANLEQACWPCRVCHCCKGRSHYPHRSATPHHLQTAFSSRTWREARSRPFLHVNLHASARAPAIRCSVGLSQADKKARGREGAEKQAAGKHQPQKKWRERFWTPQRALEREGTRGRGLSSMHCTDAVWLFPVLVVWCEPSDNEHTPRLS